MVGWRWAWDASVLSPIWYVFILLLLFFSLLIELITRLCVQMETKWQMAKPAPRWQEKDREREGTVGSVRLKMCTACLESFGTFFFSYFFYTKYFFTSRLPQFDEQPPPLLNTITRTKAGSRCRCISSSSKLFFFSSLFYSLILHLDYYNYYNEAGEGTQGSKDPRWWQKKGSRHVQCVSSPGKSFSFTSFFTLTSITLLRAHHAISGPNDDKKRAWDMSDTSQA